MDALKRTYLAPLLTVAAIVLTAVPAARIAASVASPASSATHSTPLAAALHECPSGTNWDNIKQACV